jgi:hypothetical protein
MTDYSIELEEIFSSAENAFYKNNFQSAHEFLSDLINKAPNCSKAYHKRGLIHNYLFPFP